MTDPREKQLRAELVGWIPNLRTFAISLSQGSQQADDLLQDTLLKALANLDKFQPGTNMKAWLFTILRNSFYNDIRYQKSHQTSPMDDVSTSAFQSPGTQEKYVEFKDVLRGMRTLVPEQRDAIVLIAAEGLSYAEAAVICGCPVGTVKSRLSRARQRLDDYMQGEVAGTEPVG